MKFDRLYVKPSRCPARLAKAFSWPLLVIALASCSAPTQHKTLFDALYAERHGEAAAPLPPPDPTVKPKLASASDLGHAGAALPRISANSPKAETVMRSAAETTHDSTRTTARPADDTPHASAKQIAADSRTTDRKAIRPSPLKRQHASVNPQYDPDVTRRDDSPSKVKSAAENRSEAVVASIAKTNRPHPTKQRATVPAGALQIGASDRVTAEAVIPGASLLSFDVRFVDNRCVIDQRFDDGSASSIRTDIPAPCSVGADASGTTRIEQASGQNVALVIGGIPQPTVRLALEMLGLRDCGRFVQGLLIAPEGIRTSELIIERTSFCPARDMTQEIYSIFGRTSS